MFTTTSRYVKRLDVINMQVLTKYYSSAYSLKQNWSFGQSLLLPIIISAYSLKLFIQFLYSGPKFLFRYHPNHFIFFGFLSLLLCFIERCCDTFTKYFFYFLPNHTIHPNHPHPPHPPPLFHYSGPKFLFRNFFISFFIIMFH